MKLSNKKKGVGVLLVAVVVGLVASMLTPAVGGAASPRVATASDGKITVAGLGFAQTFGDAGIGAAARFQAANENKEVKGYTFDYKELADDKNDPATALSEARRLVTQDGVLAIVPAVSVITPSRLPHAAADPVVRGRLRRHLLPDVGQRTGSASAPTGA